MNNRGIFFLLLLTGPALAQDMPLTQVLLPGESWKSVPGAWKNVTDIASDTQGNLYLSTGNPPAILRRTADGKVSTLAELHEYPDALTLGPKGNLYVALLRPKEIVRLDAAGKVTKIAKDVYATDLVVTSSGTVYYSDPYNGGVSLLTPDGKCKTLLPPRTLLVPSGITLWPGEGTLVVGERHVASLMTYRVEKDGTLSHPEPYYFLRRLPLRPFLSASLTVDRTGRVYSATSEGVQVFDVTGRMSGVLLKPKRAPIKALTFGGPDRDLLYVVCGDEVFVRKMKSRGSR